eukprot:CAMPEP_0174758260 /NCGR_PEP_ID=MMETSP1094-20130205/107674_1 /TAXON_ID=156173 /ORGANISM="Chrysochromulina brevifilum, Strain UTEX LB 985" /LENGTH=79 /DNA_ID=CAMNT_0015964187 /DNA_START=1096 /DNA_END=1336 /DNA_ORIENTATION=+
MNTGGSAGSSAGEGELITSASADAPSKSPTSTVRAFGLSVGGLASSGGLTAGVAPPLRKSFGEEESMEEHERRREPPNR